MPLFMVNKNRRKSVDIAPRYILLNNDAKVRRSNLIQLRQKIEQEEEEKSPRYPRNNYNCSNIHYNMVIPCSKHGGAGANWI